MGRRMLPAALVFIAAAVYYLTYYNYGIGLSDEGIFVNSSLRILHGQVPYLDYQYYPPALNYILALMFKAFGTSILCERLLWVLILSTSAAMSWLISRELMAFPFCLFPPLMMIVVPGPWHKAMLPLLFLAAALAGNGYIMDKGAKSALLCGITGGAAIYFRLDTSGFIVMSFAGLLVVANLLARPLEKGAFGTLAREAAALAGGLSAMLLPVAVLLGYLQYKSGYFVYIMKRMLGMRGNLGLPFPGLSLSLLATDPGAFFMGFLFYIPPLIYAAMFMTLVYRRATKGLDGRDLLLSLLLFLGVFSYNQTLVRTDYSHLMQGAHIPYILAAYIAWSLRHAVVQDARGGLRQAAGRAVTILTAAAALTYCYVNVSLAHPYGGTLGIMKGRDTRLGLSRAPVILTPDEAAEVGGLVEVIVRNTAPGEPILVLPYEPMLYFLADRPNPTRFDGVFPGTLADRGREEEFIDAVRKGGVRLVVFTDMRFTPEEKSRLKNYNKGLYGFLTKEYRKVETIGGHEIYLKRDGDAL